MELILASTCSLHAPLPIEYGKQFSIILKFFVILDNRLLNFLGFDQLVKEENPEVTRSERHLQQQFICCGGKEIVEVLDKICLPREL